MDSDGEDLIDVEPRLNGINEKYSSEPLSHEFSATEAIGQLKEELEESISSVVDQFSTEIKSLRNEMESAANKFHPPPPDLSCNPTVTVILAEDESIADIRAKTNTEEEKFVESNLKKLIARMNIMDGVTLFGNTVSSIFASVGGDTSMVLEICNFLNCTLTEPKNLLLNGKPGNAFPGIVSAETREMLCFYSRSGYTQVLISFAIASQSLRLIASFIVRREGGIHLVLAIAPMETLIDEALHSALWDKNTDHKYRPDKKRGYYEGHPGHLFAKCGSIVARAKVNPGTKALVTLMLANMEEEEGAAMASDLIDKELQRSIPVTNQSLSSNEDYVITFEMNNFLSVYLEDVCVFINSGNRTGHFPAMIRPRCKQVFYESHHNSVEGVFSYRIRSTDMRIAVAFCIEPGENHFSVGFTPLEIPTDKTLMETLFARIEWRTRPDKRFAQAKEGEVVIFLRNVMLRVKCSDDPKAILRLAIFTF